MPHRITKYLYPGLVTAFLKKDPLQKQKDRQDTVKVKWWKILLWKYITDTHTVLLSNTYGRRQSGGLIKGEGWPHLLEGFQEGKTISLTRFTLWGHQANSFIQHSSPLPPQLQLELSLCRRSRKTCSKGQFHLILHFFLTSSLNL
jgi:hypothetical protein